MSKFRNEAHKKEVYEFVMEEATKVFGVDPAYFGEEGREEVEHQLNKIGFSIDDFKEEV